VAGILKRKMLTLKGFKIKTPDFNAFINGNGHLCIIQKINNLLTAGL
jgi:hypothetical protein